MVERHLEQSGIVQIQLMLSPYKVLFLVHCSRQKWCKRTTSYSCSIHPAVLFLFTLYFTLTQLYCSHTYSCITHSPRCIALTLTHTNTHTHTHTLTQLTTVLHKLTQLYRSHSHTAVSLTLKHSCIAHTHTQLYRSHTHSWLLYCTNSPSCIAPTHTHTMYRSIPHTHTQLTTVL